MTTDLGTTPRRKLSTRERLAVFERDKGCCYLCSRQIRAGDDWICEHPRALALGGEDDRSLLRVACKWCATEKTKDDVRRIAKAKRTKARHLGIKTKRRSIPGSKDTPFRKKLNGEVERR